MTPRIHLALASLALVGLAACGPPIQPAEPGTWQKTPPDHIVANPDGSQVMAAMRHVELEAGQTLRLALLGRGAAPGVSVFGPDFAPVEAGLVLRATVPASTGAGTTGRYVLADLTAATTGQYTIAAPSQPDCPSEPIDMRVDILQTVSTSFTDRNGVGQPLPPPASALGVTVGQGTGQSMGQDLFVTLPFRSTGPATLCLAGGTAGMLPITLWSVWFDARAGQTIRAELKGSGGLKLALTGGADGSPQVNAVTEGDSQVASLTIPADGIYSAGVTFPSSALQAGPVPYDLSVKVAQ